MDGKTYSSLTTPFIELSNLTYEDISAGKINMLIGNKFSLESSSEDILTTAINTATNSLAPLTDVPRANVGPFVEATLVTTSEMFPYMDENVGNYIALGFFFAFVVAVIILISVVGYCCLKRRKKLRLEKNITKIENPKYASQPSRYPQSFDFLSSQNVRAEFKNDQDESSVTLISMEKKSPHVAISVDNPSSGTSLYSFESNKAENKRYSKASDFPAASVMSVGNNSEVSIPLTIGNENLSSASSNRSPLAKEKDIIISKQSNSPTKKKTPILTPLECDPNEQITESSEALSWPLLETNETKNFRIGLTKLKEPEITDDDDAIDDDENATDQSTSLLKSKEQSMLSLGSYDRSLNPFCN